MDVLPSNQYEDLADSDIIVRLVGAAEEGQTD